MQRNRIDEKCDLEKFHVPDSQLEVKYGLPRELKFCEKCVISNQRPNSTVEYVHKKESKKRTINIDEKGVCDACRMAEYKNTKVNWMERENELRELCDQYRRDDGSYDCIVPGSGGKDSFFQSYILKYKYNMHPLTITWAPHIYTEWGWKNFQSWIHSGFDNILFTPNGKVHRLLTHLALVNLFHPFQPFIFGQKSLAPRLAILHKIPLIFYGENEAEYGNPVADNQTARRDGSYFTADGKENIYLGGVSVSDLKQYFGVDVSDLQAYLPADPEEIEKSKVEVRYLGYYIKWHPQECYYFAAEHGGFQASPERTPGTYSKYNSIDDRIDDFHYYTTYIKFGIGRATYDAAQEIRNEEITREEGVSLVKKYDGEFPTRFSKEFYGYVSIPEKEFPVASKMVEQSFVDEEYFSFLADRFRSPHLWKRECGTWKLRHTVHEK